MMRSLKGAALLVLREDEVCGASLFFRMTASSAWAKSPQNLAGMGATRRGGCDYSISFGLQALLFLSSSNH